MNEHIERAVRVCGSQKKLGAAAGVSQAAVQKWLYGRRVSAENALAIERATGGAVTRYQLRPDVFGSAPQ